jgi:hypothetical protein
MAAKSPKLTAKKRAALPKSSFALPAQKKYPIDTAGRARDALARVSANGTPGQKAQVRKAVAKRYPAIKVSRLAKKK